jgi:hypothetical protein
MMSIPVARLEQAAGSLPAPHRVFAPRTAPHPYSVGLVEGRFFVYNAIEGMPQRVTARRPSSIRAVRDHAETMVGAQPCALMAVR